MTDYPSPKEALLGNGHVANAWCAIKYVVWHTLFAVLAVLVAALMGVVLLGVAAFGPVATRVTLPEAVAKAVERVDDYIQNNESTVLKVCFIGFGLVTLPAVIEFVLWAIDNPVMFLAYVGGIVLGAVAIISLFYGYYELFPSVKAKSSETPVTRRVLGHCPVSMTTKPRWFESLQERFL